MQTERIVLSFIFQQLPLYLLKLVLLCPLYCHLHGERLKYAFKVTGILIPSHSDALYRLLSDKSCDNVPALCKITSKFSSLNLHREIRDDVIHSSPMTSQYQ